MKNKLLLLALLSFFLFPIVLASSVDQEISRITHYAEEYETGNIDYVQLQLYLSSVRQDLNEILGVTNMDEGGLLNEEQIRKALGEPTENTNWIWVEGQEREKRIEKPIPVWNTIIFDGKKIQIRLDAWPSLFDKKFFRIGNRIRDLEEREGSLEEIEELKKELNEESSGEGTIVYRLHFNIEFKRPQEQINVQSRISEIQQLAQEFSSNPSNENANTLAKESVNAERAFESYMRQNQQQCTDLMNSIFGSENQRGTEKLIVKEVVISSGENFEIIARLEMCDDCEWSWIGLNLWTETRGFNMVQEEQGFDSRPDEYRNLEFSEFESKIREAVDEYKSAIDEKDWRKANQINQRLWALNDAWSQKSNDVWPEVEGTFEDKRQSMTQEQQNEYYSNYGWLKDEQEKRKKVKELSKQNYEKRKAFYNNLLSSYELRKEFYFEQVSFEKRLVEEFKEFGEEICNNNLDDNNNEQIDCSESQCGGKICGEETIEIVKGNETRTETVDLYCIAGACQRKEVAVEINVSVCGNNICEEGEANIVGVCESNADPSCLGSPSIVGICPQDCTTCPKYPPLECVGKVIFSGSDSNGCLLKPVCVEEETITCNVDEDCIDPLCGDATCVEGVCQTSTLTECRESECVDGQERLGHCNSGESIIGEVCINGMWSKTNVECESGEFEETEEIAEEEIAGAECAVKSDCGGENDVCSNGRCVTLPQTSEFEETISEEIREEIDEIAEGSGQQETEGIEEEQESEAESEGGITGGFIFNLFRSVGKITGTAITGLTSDEGSQESSSDSGDSNNGEVSGDTAQTNEGDNTRDSGEFNQDQQFGESQQQNVDDFDGQGREEDRNRQDEEERDRRESECNERCARECYDLEIRPCVEKCIFDECGQNFECNVDEIKSSCENSCKEEKDTNVCESECNDKCIKGEETWKEPEREEHKEEKGVFTAGGSCRTAKGVTEGFIWFGGWGDPFQEIQPLKTKYYSGGGDWCKWDLENLLKQRRAFEEGFNQKFVEWFFNNYLANSAGDWESHISGIFELYWKDVEISREIANRMKCLNIKELPEHALIGPLIYKSDFGSMEFWEEATLGKIDREGEPVLLITPYLKIWILPSKEVIEFEMKNAMKEHRFPGPQDEENSQGGPSEEEKEFIRQDEDFMNKIRKLSDKYGGSFDGALQIVDNGEIIFNVYVQINENDIIKMTPMLPEETPEKDATIQLEFEKIYDLISIGEKEMRSTRIESPPWAPRKVEVSQKVKEVVSGIKMYFKMKSLISSSEVVPSSAEKDVKNMFNEVIKRMMEDGNGPEGEFSEDDERGTEEDISSWESKEKLTGNVIG